MQPLVKFQFFVCTPAAGRQVLIPHTPYSILRNFDIAHNIERTIIVTIMLVAVAIIT